MSLNERPLGIDRNYININHLHVIKVQIGRTGRLSFVSEVGNDYLILTTPGLSSQMSNLMDEVLQEVDLR